MEPQTGRISHYRVLGELGRDRLGYVLRASDELLDRPVVLRIVRAATVFPPERVPVVRDGFQREARRAAGVGHPNLVTIYAFEPIGDIDLIAMELVEGASLRAMLALGDRWRIPEAAKLVARIADAVAAAHAVRVTHGRLSLANVVIRPDGRVKVLDLGIPKLPEADVGSRAGVDPDRVLSHTSDPRADLRALALITWEVAASAMRAQGALWRPVNPETEEMAAAVADPATARARFGILGPVLNRVLAPAPGEALRDAAAFRDAVLAALAEPAAPQVASSQVEPLVPRSRFVHPEPAPIAPATPGGLLDVDGAAIAAMVASAGATPESGRAPRLVLPADLAEKHAELPGDGTFVVMGERGLLEGLRHATGGLGARLSRRVERVGSGALITAVLVVVVLLGGALAASRVFGGASAQNREPARPGGQGSTLLAGGEPDSAAPRAAIDPVTAAPQPSGQSSERPPITTPLRTTSDSVPMLEAMVRAFPQGATIRLSGGDRRWTDETLLSVANGDSLIVLFSRPGYVSTSRVFKGTRIAVNLQPDSARVIFEANVPAQVFLAPESGGRRLLGNTPFSALMPTGTYRFVFRAAEQAEWTVTQRVQNAGASYRIAKSDFASAGGLVVNVTGSWAWVSIDGGPDQETPLRIQSLSAGTHRIRVSREGYFTISDTVVVRPGRIETKQYTLRPQG